MASLLRAGFVLTLMAQVAGAQSLCPPPSGRMIKVAPNVRLHVMDWGGEGETILFLSGLGSSAHAFDDFAQFFVDRYRVVGITRRGTPPSDTPVAGYDADQKTADIVAIMDSLKIDRAHVVGWSFGGDEAALLAVRYPHRVRSLVLLDSYDNSIEAGTFKSTSGFKVASQPWESGDSSSVEGYARRIRRSGQPPLPLAHYCVTFKFGADGRFAGPSQSDSIVKAIVAGTPKLPYGKIQQPVLAFFRHSRVPGDEYLGFYNMDSVNAAVALERFYADSMASAAARKRLRTELRNATVIELPGSRHAVFAFSPTIVFPQMIAFYNRLERNASLSRRAR